MQLQFSKKYFLDNPWELHCVGDYSITKHFAQVYVAADYFLNKEGYMRFTELGKTGEKFLSLGKALGVLKQENLRSTMNSGKRYSDMESS